MKRDILAALAALALVAAAPAPVPVARAFSDWVAACDNTRQCSAKSLIDPLQVADADDIPDDTVRITREAGPEGRLTVTFTTDAETAPTGVAIDGQPVGSLTWHKNDDGLSAAVTGDAALDLARRLSQASTVTTSRPGAKDARISLRGAAASLLLFDDVQGRVGTTTALMRPGSAAASTVPPAPALPVFQAAAPPPPLANGKALAAAVRRRQATLLSKNGCDDAIPKDSDDAQPLTAQDAVVILVCNRGAYQSSALAFRVPRGAPAQARLLVLPSAPGVPRGGDAGDGTQQMALDYDPAHATMSAVAKGNGVATCGAAQQWVFDGTAFHTSSVTFQDRCAGPPGDWPTLFRSRVLPAR